MRFPVTIESLRELHPKEHIDSYHIDSGGDKESIGSCYVCGRPLATSLTWITQELEHHEEHSINYGDLTSSRTAYDIILLLEAMPSQDYTFSGYDKYQYSLGNKEPYKQKLKWINEFNQRVVNLAKRIIAVFATECFLENYIPKLTETEKSILLSAIKCHIEHTEFVIVFPLRFRKKLFYNTLKEIIAQLPDF